MKNHNYQHNPLLWDNHSSYYGGVDLFIMFTFFSFLLGCTLGISTDEMNLHHHQGPTRISTESLIGNLSTHEIFLHLQNFLQFTEMNVAYENSRMRARDYIVETLTSTKDGSYGFTGEQVLYHKFDWTDTTIEKKGSYEETTITTTWSGVNILAWTNTSALPKGKKFSVVAGRYDSRGWWSENHGNTYPCVTNSKNPMKDCYKSGESSQTNLSPRAQAITTASDLLGASILLQLARYKLNYEKQRSNEFEKREAEELIHYWNKDDPLSIEVGRNQKQLERQEELDSVLSDNNNNNNNKKRKIKKDEENKEWSNNNNKEEWKEEEGEEVDNNINDKEGEEDKNDNEDDKDGGDDDDDVPILFIFFDQESAGNIGSQVWAEYYNIDDLIINHSILSLSSIDISFTSWKPYDPISSKMKSKSSYSSWKPLSPSLTLDSSWLSSLMAPYSEIQHKRILSSSPKMQSTTFKRKRKEEL